MGSAHHQRKLNNGVTCAESQEGPIEGNKISKTERDKPHFQHSPDPLVLERFPAVKVKPFKAPNVWRAASLSVKVADDRGRPVQIAFHFVSWCVNEQKKWIEGVGGKVSDDQNERLNDRPKLEATLEEVLVAALFLLLLDLGEDRQELVELDLLLAALLGAAHFADEVQRRVQVQGAEGVAEVKGIDLAGTFPIVDGEDELRLCGRES
uniref:Uncharacterized protein n=1 Tax=Anopheles atroparvus TaxID=41427 RepID=A0A182JM50_ANOAO